MLGLKLFIHAARMVFTNLVPMMQIFALPLAVVLAVTMAFSTYVGLGPFFIISGQSVQFNNISGGLLAAFVCSFFIIWLALMNGVVHWHRYILLGEKPGVLMLQVSWRQVAKYVVGGIVILGVLILPFWLLGMIAGRVAIGFAMNEQLLAAQGIMTAVSIFFTAIFLALSPILPANAVDRNFKISDGLSAMSGSLGALIICAIGLAVLQWGDDVLFRQLATLNLQLAAVIGIVVQMMVAMIGVSLITTIYGHFVEERPLS